MANRPLTLSEMKALALAERQLRLGEPSLAEMRARRRAAVVGLAPTPMTPPGSPGPVWMPGQSAYVVPGEPLDTRRLAAQRRLGLQPAGIMRGDSAAPDARALVPATYRPLAGLAPNQRGQSILVDSTKFNAPTTRDNPNGYFPRTTVVQATSPGDDAEAMYVTLGFKQNTSVPAEAVGIDYFDTRCLAEVTWGIGGAEFTATCDWVNGTILNVCANYLRVVAIVPDNGGLTTYTKPWPVFQLTAGIGYGSPPTTLSRARRTVAVELTSPTIQAEIDVPDFAVGYTIMTNDQTMLPITVTQIEETGAPGAPSYVNTFNNVQNTSNQDPRTFVIGHGVRKLRLNITSSTEVPAYAFVVFNLAL